MDVLAVIPAVSSVAVRPLGGESLASQALKVARAARRISRIAVVTADAELARRSSSDHVDVVSPPAEGGMPTILAASLETLAQDGFAPSIAVLLDPAFAMRAPEVVDGALDQLLRCGADSLLSVRPAAGGLWLQDARGLAAPLDHGAGQPRYVETGSVTAIRVGVFQQTGEIPCGRVVLYEVPPLAALPLDEAGDWIGMEWLQRQMSAARARALLRNVALLAFDFDGVMTDNRVLVMEDGREGVLCNRGDGMGLGMLQAAGLPLVVISKEQNPVVNARCRKLKIPCEQGIDDKLTVLQRICRDQGVSMENVAFMGNDVNDVSCLEAAGIAIVPADAHPDVLRLADLVTSAAGGFGAVREVCDTILAARAAETEHLRS